MKTNQLNITKAMSEIKGFEVTEELDLSFDEAVELLGADKDKFLAGHDLYKLGLKRGIKHGERALNRNLDDASLKMDQVKILSEVVGDIYTEIEKLAVKFDKREESSSQWLSYETSRQIERLISLNYMIGDFAREAVNGIEQPTEQLTKPI